MTAQDLSNFSIELSTLRHAKSHGWSQDYDGEYFYFPGINLMYKSSPRFQYFLGVANANASVETSGIDTYEQSSIRGAEFRLGARLTPLSEKRLSASLGIEIFGEFSKIHGTYETSGFQTEFYINHQRNYMGVAPSVMLSVRITERISLFADTRYRAGIYTLNSSNTEYPSQKLLSNKKEWLEEWDVLNSLGIRIRL